MLELLSRFSASHKKHGKIVVWVVFLTVLTFNFETVLVLRLKHTEMIKNPPKASKEVLPEA